MISIIIPVLNEATTIGALLTDISKKTSLENISEILLVDGGSEDETIHLATSFYKKLPLSILKSQKGRAKQMNMGAQQASGSILYFVHADTTLPENFDTQLISQIENGFVAGCFRMKFDSNHPILKLSQWFTRFNVKSCRGGDQTLFISKSVFQKLNGFNESFIIYEDCEFTNRIYDQFNFVVMKDYVITSARRYKNNGTLKLQYHFTIIHIKKWLGASPKSLVAYYRKYIA
ncbi:MAG: TIGR04283 family arsenosugar biosynthesis glycosyltransferase [Aequorivita sp.]|nr:TIGR04283 family arsenosugar biosynthesis glycosyltransferase [Aequorivita sp.]